MIVLGLVIAAVGFFLALTKEKYGLLPIVIQGIGWGLILVFGILLLASGHGVVLPQ